MATANGVAPYTQTVRTVCARARHICCKLVTLLRGVNRKCYNSTEKGPRNVAVRVPGVVPLFRRRRRRARHRDLTGAGISRNN